MKKNLDNDMIKRAMIAFQCKKVNDLATLFNMSPQNLNGYIDRGTFIKLIEPETYKRHLNLHWIKTGLGAMTAGHGTGTYIGETIPSYANASDIIPIRISNPLIQKTAAILESATVYSTALKSNIEAFHHAMTCEEQLDLANKRIDTLEEHVKAIESRLPKVNES